MPLRPLHFLRLLWYRAYQLHDLALILSSDSFSLVPVHDERSLKRPSIRLQPPHGISLILCSADHLACCAWSAQVIQDVLELVGCRWGLCDIELELGALGFVLRFMRAGLVFSRVRNRLCVGLFEKSEDAGGSLVRGRVEQSYDVLCAVLSKAPI